jgi:hypothetical protein
MSGKTSQLTPLETKKQLLLVESELNRAQLLNELRDFKNEIQRLKHQVGGIVSTAELATKVISAFFDVGRAFSHRDEGEKPSWISTLLNGAKAGMSLWRLMRSRRRKA